MSSVRKTKKQIRYACGDVAAGILMTSYVLEGLDKEKSTALVCETATLQADALSKCTFSFDKAKADFANDKEYRKARHAYTKAAFAKLNEEFVAGLQSVVDGFNAAMPKGEAK